MASTLAFVIGKKSIQFSKFYVSSPASTLVTPSETEIAKACAVVDTGSHTGPNVLQGPEDKRAYKELIPLPGM